MVSDEAVLGLCNQLQTEGSACFTDPSGKRLMFVASSCLSFVPENQPSVLLAYEGEGVFLWRVGTMPTRFDLISSGFGFNLAPTLADVLHRLARALEGGSPKVGARPLLTAATATDEKE